MAGNDRYSIPQGEHRVEQSIQKSRFIATVGGAESSEEAQQFIARIASEFADATHNCWAYLIGAPGCTDRVGMSDDGEPHGTAGRPMLNALVYSGVGDVVAVVTRYYGGTKLGTGGLVRAYSGSVQAALESMPRAERVDYSVIQVLVDYAHVDAVKQVAATFEAETLAETYGETVSFTLRLPTPDLEAFTQSINDATRGRAQMKNSISLM